jgi:hypothetical protein
LLAADDELHLTRPAMGLDAAIEIAHRPGFQATQFPCDLLFEGGYDALLSAVASGAFDDLEDEAPWLDRLFLIREAADELDHPRSAVDVLALKVAVGGSWRAIVADGEGFQNHVHAAARWYSWMSPPSRSWRSTVPTVGRSIAVADSGGCSASAR